MSFTIRFGHLRLIVIVGYLLGKEREGMKVMFIRAKLSVQKTRCKVHMAVRPLFERPFAARL
ncbi:MAG: hypothetical protein ABSE54_08790 [Smithella sp.]